ncbi:MAG: IS110 family transposase [Gammaproteobacteria bacterium]|nr:IS110 family transposase [Gammaproteobacteria bacterium]
MAYHTALDVSLRSVSICVIDDDGVILHEAKVASDVDAIVGCLKRFSLDIRTVGFEAGTLTQYLTYGLQSAGYEVICLEARQVSAALAAMRNKTDRNDARGIAQILRTGWYSRVHVKSLESHLIRALLSSRKAVLKKCVDLENELRGLIRLLGVRLPGTLKHGAFDAVLREAIATHAALAPALVPLLDARLVLYQTYLKLDNQVKSLVRDDAVCQRLMTVPGVGSITALTFKAGVDDPTRFKRSRTVAAHFGLTPRRYQSGEVDNPGHISKAGDPDVRSALYVAANALVTRSAEWSSLKVWGRRLAKTRGHQRAVIAVARKLAVILHKMWLDGTDFRYGSAEAAS